MEAERGKVAAKRKDTQRALDLVQQLMAHRNLRELSIHLGANGATLNSASWTTASSTGALEFMGYAETKRFAQAYQLQEILLRLRIGQRPRRAVNPRHPVTFVAFAFFDPKQVGTDSKFRRSEA